jgi:hypothetical protein
MPDMTGDSGQLDAFMATFTTAVAELGADRIGFLIPELTYQSHYLQFCDRAATETLVRLVAFRDGLTYDRITKAKVRALLKRLEEAGIESVVEGAVAKAGAYWANGRSHAAIAALAVERL